MKNKLTKLMALMLSAVIVASVSACGGKGKTEDPTKAHLYVFNYNGGIGSDWLYEAEARFEQVYANYSFDGGKTTGVDVHVEIGKNKIGSLAESKYNILFEEGVPVNDYIAQDLLLPITDVVKSPLNTILGNSSENKTIEDKLEARQIAAYTAKGGDYYYLPHYECYYGLTYDRNVFKKKSLFITRDGGWTNGNDADILSVGSDGIKGTYDDGLPSSYEEFFNLMDRMLNRTVVPFIWSGQYQTYLNILVAGIWAAYAGADQLMLNVNFDSQATGATVKNETVTGITNGEPTIRLDEITSENGYLTSWQAGKFYGYKVLNKILSNSDYYSDEITGVLTHLEAQQSYIYSDLENKPIGMLIDGSYWYNEAKAMFAMSQREFPDKGANRDFRWMPLPVQAEGQVQEGKGRKNTMVSPLLAYSYVNGNIRNDEVKVKLAKEFLKFLYTDKELQNFTLSTNCAKGVNYELTVDQQAKLTNFGKSLYTMKQASDIVEPVSASPIYVNTSLKFRFANDSDFFVLRDSTGREYFNLKAATDAGKSYTEVFLYGRKTESEWRASYSKYFG